MTAVQVGTLYGISVGPGDPELITLKGLRILKQVAVVAFPSGIQGKPGIAQRIVDEWLENHQVQLALTFPYVQDMVVLTQAWKIAAEQVWQYLHLGQDVAFVCEGDVSFYSTFTYLAEVLQQLHPEAYKISPPNLPRFHAQEFRHRQSLTQFHPSKFCE